MELKQTKQRKKTLEQLKNDLSLKIKGIRTLLEQALKYDLESDERLEHSNMIASSLRAILYGDTNNENLSLIQRVGYDKKLLFPLYDPNICLNVLPTYNLLQFSISNNGAKVNVSENLFKDGGMWKIYLTYDSWLNEVVIDSKLQDVNPISRLLVVKIIADTAGSHVDNNMEEHIFEMSKHDLLPVVIVNGAEVPRNLELKAKSIFCETILGIAKELIDAYKIWLGLSLKLIGTSDIIVRIQKYPKVKNKFELLKYGIIKENCPFKVNTYNSNSYFECDVFSKGVSMFEVIRNRRRFKIKKIDYIDILGGDYLGKSIYLRE